MPLTEPLKSMLFPLPPIERTLLAPRLNQLSLQWQKTARVFYRALNFLVGLLLTLSIIWPTYHLYWKDRSLTPLPHPEQNTFHIIDSSTTNIPEFAPMRKEDFLKERKFLQPPFTHFDAMIPEILTNYIVRKDTPFYKPHFPTKTREKLHKLENIFRHFTAQIGNIRLSRDIDPEGRFDTYLENTHRPVIFLNDFPIDIDKGSALIDLATCFSDEKKRISSSGEELKKPFSRRVYKSLSVEQKVHYIEKYLVHYLTLKHCVPSTVFADKKTGEDTLNFLHGLIDSEKPFKSQFLSDKCLYTNNRSFSLELLFYAIYRKLCVELDALDKRVSEQNYVFFLHRRDSYNSLLGEFYGPAIFTRLQTLAFKSIQENHHRLLKKLGGLFLHRFTKEEEKLFESVLDTKKILIMNRDEFFRNETYRIPRNFALVLRNNPNKEEKRAFRQRIGNYSDADLVFDPLREDFLRYKAPARVPKAKPPIKNLFEFDQKNSPPFE